MKRNQSTALVRLFSSSLRLSLAFGVVGVFASVGSVASTSKDTYYVNDHLASTVATSDAAGEIAQIESDAFGTQADAVAKNSRFTGKPYDADMGAYVFPFRNYRSDEARWMSADPSGFPDGVNSLHYACEVNRSVDAFGLTAELLSGYWRSTSTTWTAIQYSSNVSSTDASGFESALTALYNLNVSETNFQLNFLQDSNNRVTVLNRTDGIASGHYVGTIANDGLDAALSFTLSASAYATSPASEIYPSASVTIAHELGHAIMDAPDPTDLALGDHSAVTAVGYEDYVRTALGGSYRTAYHGVSLDSHGWRTE